MEISQKAYIILILYSLVLGVFLGGVYDVIRIMRIALRPAHKEGVNSGGIRKGFELIEFLFVFVTDIIFCIISAASIIVLVYYKNSGIIRWFVLAFAALGFFTYYNTVGKAVILCSEKIISFIRRAVYFIYKITLKPILSLFKLIFKNIYDKIIRESLKRRSKKLRSRLLEKAEKGFV